MKHLKPTLVLLSAAVAAGCAREPEGSATPSARDETLALGTEVAATVNGEAIPMSVFRLYALNSLNKDADSLTDEERQALMDDLVNYTLLVQVAEKEGLFGERRFAAELALQRLQTVARSMAERYIDRNQPTEAEIQAVYDENADELKSMEYKIKHIVVDNAEKAEEIIETLNEGTTFDTLAKEYTENPELGGVSDLGWVPRQSLSDPILTVIEGLEPGSHSPEPLQTEFGYHVVFLEDARELEAPPAESIRAELTRAAENNRLKAYLDSLRSEAAIDQTP